jgi:hypothetical protein
MIRLNELQRQDAQDGKPIQVQDPETGMAFVLLRAGVYDRLQNLLEEDMPDMRTMALLIERNMAEDDAADPLLESYR